MKRLVLIVNFGGPRSESEIPLFLSNLMGRTPAAALVESVAARYRTIGGSSPLPGLTEEIARLLQTRMGTDTGVRAAFLFSHPGIPHMLESCCREGVEEILFFIFSPYYSVTILDAALGMAEEFFACHADYKPVFLPIHSWYREQWFIDWWGRRLQETAESERGAFFLFSAHSLPVSPSAGVYRSQIEETMRTIVEASALTSYGLAWQSAVPRSGEEWIGPPVEEVLGSLAGRGIRRVIQVPLGFVMDHLETLYDMDVLHRNHARACDLDYRRLPCPNADPLFLDGLADLISRRIRTFQ